MRYRNFSIGKALLVLVYFLGAATMLMAQPGDPGSDPDQAVPISGLEILIGSGVVLGIRSLINARKKDKGD